MAIDLSQVPVLLGEFLGLSSAHAGVLLTAIFVVSVMMALSILKVGILGEAIAGTGVTALFTVIRWVDIWLIVMEIFIVAALLGDKISKIARSSEG